MRKQIVAAIAALVLAVLGVLALVSYAHGANDRAFKGATLVSVLQVQSDVPANTPASRLAGNVTLVKVPKVAVIPGALTTLDGVAKLSTNTALVKGEQLVRSRFGNGSATKSTSAVPPGYQEISISVDAPRALGGDIKAGDRVGVLASYNGTGGEAGPTNFLAQQVQVTRVSTGAIGKAADANGAAVLVTLAVKTLDAEKVANAIEFGKVWLTMQNDETDSHGRKVTDSKDVLK
ncbi:MAG: cpaB [Aeromicrobium sp.]|nr:cpaB [Aeromicrobium sp.]